jgi:hypothetical protein
MSFHRASLALPDDNTKSKFSDSDGSCGTFENVKCNFDTWKMKMLEATKLKSIVRPSRRRCIVFWLLRLWRCVMSLSSSLLPTIVDAANGSDQLYSYYDIISVVFQA